MIIPTTGGISPNVPVPPQLGVGDTGVSDILTFFRELRAFLEIPVVQDIIRQKMQVQNSSGGRVPDEPYKPQKTDISPDQNTPPSPSPPKKEPPINPEDFLLAQIATPEGRKSLSDGIQKIRDIMGDVKLSELQNELTKDDIKKKGVKKK